MQKNVRLPQVELNMERVAVVRWLVDLDAPVAVDQVILEKRRRRQRLRCPARKRGFYACNAQPLVMSSAKERGIDLGLFAGTGPGGRVTEADVRTSDNANASESGDWKPIGPVRRALNEQMERSLNEIPQFHVRRELEATRLMLEESGLTFTHRLICCAATALTKYPALRTSIDDSKLKEHPVAMHTPSGPAAPAADQLTLNDIADTTKGMAQSAGAQKRADLTNAPFAISNLGMFGVDSFDAFLFRGQTAVLAIGRTREVDGGVIACFSLALGHRIVNGVEKARFLGILQTEINQA